MMAMTNRFKARRFWFRSFFFAVLLLGAARSPGSDPFEVTAAQLDCPTSIPLDGFWSFAAAADELSAGGESPSEIDGAAVRVDRQVQGKAWHALQVPQFLNRIRWWITISQEFERQEEQRLNALGFDAEKTESGWYRKQVVLPAVSDPDAEVRACFEGVAMVSRVYCNGRYAGGHTGMFGAFECRLTPFLKWGTTNNLLVFVQRGMASRDDDEAVGVAVTMTIKRDMFTSLNRGMFGDFGRAKTTRNMGIWQPVTLKTGRIGGWVEDAFFNPSLSGHRLEMTIRNTESRICQGSLRYRLSDAVSGEIFLERTLPVMKVPPNASETAADIQKGLSPKLWSPASPHLYVLDVEWRSEDGARVIDRWSHKVGYRTVEMRGPQVYLNGKPYWVRGADMPPYGYRPNDAGVARHFLELMREGNTPVTRSHCNPWNSLWLSQADEIGIGVCSEGVRPWALMSKEPPPPPAILAHWKAEHLETVRQNRNHPSILFYCISNEGLQGDHENPEKIAIFGDIVRANRVMHPGIPVFQTSGDRDVGGNADLESLHSYWGWYQASSFMNDYRRPQGGLPDKPGKPFLNLECAVPYHDTDTGGQNPVYISRHTGKAWVGEQGELDPGRFAEHASEETKRKAEMLRICRRELPTAGVALFCNSTWIQHVISRPPAEWKPLPVWEAARLGLAPVLVAVETPQRVLFSGAKLPTRLFVVNDDEQCRDFRDLKARLRWVDERGACMSEESLPLGDVSYFQVRDWPIVLRAPSVTKGMSPVTLQLVLSSGETAISTNHYGMRLASPAFGAVAADASLVIAHAGCDATVVERLSAMGAKLIPLAGAVHADAVLLGSVAVADDQKACQALKPGGRILLLQQGAKAARFCPDILKPVIPPNDPKLKPVPATVAVKGEFVEMLEWGSGNPLFAGLDAMDWKWWGMDPTAGEAYACTARHRLDPGTVGAGVKLIGRYVSPHFSGWTPEIALTQGGFPVFSVHRDWGWLVVCDLAITEAIAHDPRAGLTLLNLLSKPL